MSGKMKDYIGQKKDGFEVLDTTLETDAAGNQKLLVQKIIPPDKGWIFVIPANKFVAGQFPASATQKRKSNIAKRPKQIKKIDNKYRVTLVLKGESYARIFNSKREAIRFLKQTNADYIKDGSLPSKKNIAKCKISDHVYKRKDHENVRFIFEFHHNGEQCCRSFRHKEDALNFEQLFFERYDPKKPLPFIKYKSYNNTSHKFIHLHKNTYYFEKTYKGKRYRKGFDNLNDALDYRNQWLTDHNLPIPD